MQKQKGITDMTTLTGILVSAPATGDKIRYAVIAAAVALVLIVLMRLLKPKNK